MTTSPTRSRTRLLVAALGAVALAVPLLGSVGSPAVAEPGDPSADPAVTLVAPDRVTARRYGRQVYTDLGIRLEVRDAPLEIWTQRAPDYRSAPTATAKLPSGDVALPAPTNVGVLDTFLRLRFVKRNDPDAKPIRRKRDACLGSGRTRIEPGAPFRSDYPQGCYYNPYALGGVQGVSQGWSATVFENASFRLKPGRYDVTIRVPRAYADALGIEDNVLRQVLVVKKGECRGCREESGDGDHDRRDDRRARPNRTEPDADRGIRSLADLPPGTPTPDLRSLPAFGIELNRKGTQLRFSANVWNAGDSPLVVDGFRRKGEDVMDAYQYFFDPDGNQIDYRQVGEMIWHAAPSHNHWHFTDFAVYQLVDANQENPLRSGKESFCLANTDAVDLTVDGADWQVEEDDLGSVCGGRRARSIRETLSSGWGDTYAQFRAGQAFGIKNVPDGIYYIRILANPDQNLIESDVTNNESLRKIRLWTNKRGVRKLKVFKVGLVDESDGIYYRTR